MKTQPFLSNMTKVLLIPVTLLSLVACDGGGGGGASPPPAVSTSCTWDTSAWDNCNWGS